MSHFETGPLAGYNSLTDPHLAAYFTNRRIRRHLCKSGLIEPNGRVVPETDYRSNNAQKEHQRQVREMIAQAIVHKALDMERMRQAAFRKQYEEEIRLLSVRRVRDERRRKDEELFPLLASRATSASPQRKSATRRKEDKARSPRFGKDAKRSQSVERHRHPHDYQHHQHDRRRHGSHSDESSDRDSEYERRTWKAKKNRDENEELEQGTWCDKRSSMPPNHRSPYTLIPPLLAGLVPNPPYDRPRTSAPTFRRSQNQLREKSRPRTAQESPTETSECRVKMHYFGSSVFRYGHQSMWSDHITVEQQPSGAGSLIVYKDMVKPDSDFEFTSRRNQNFPFSLTLYINGQKDCRLSSCCEFKRKPNSLIGGVSRSHFSLISVKGGKPCFNCYKGNNRKNKAKKAESKTKKEAETSKKRDNVKETKTKSVDNHSKNTKSATTKQDKVTKKKSTTTVHAQKNNSEAEEEMGKKSDSENSSETNSRKSSISLKSKSSSISKKSGKKHDSDSRSSDSSGSDEEQNKEEDRSTVLEIEADSESDSSNDEKKNKKRFSKADRLHAEERHQDITDSSERQRRSDSEENDHKDKKRNFDNESTSSKRKGSKQLESSSSSSDSDHDNLERKKKASNNRSDDEEKRVNIPDHNDKQISNDEDGMSDKHKNSLDSSSSSSDSEVEQKDSDQVILKTRNETETPDRSILYDKKDTDSQDHGILHDRKDTQTPDRSILYDRKDTEDPDRSFLYYKKETENMNGLEVSEKQKSLNVMHEEQKARPKDGQPTDDSSSYSDSSSDMEADSPHRVQVSANSLIDVHTRAQSKLDSAEPDGKHVDSIQLDKHQETRSSESRNSDKEDKEDETEEDKDGKEKFSDAEGAELGKKENIGNEKASNNKNTNKVELAHVKDVEHSNKGSISKNSSRASLSDENVNKPEGSHHSLSGADRKLLGDKIKDGEDKKEKVSEISTPELKTEEKIKPESSAGGTKDLLNNIQKYYIEEAQSFEGEQAEQKMSHSVGSVKDGDRILRKTDADKDDPPSDSDESSDNDIILDREVLARAEDRNYKD